MEPSMPPLEEFIPFLQEIWANKWLTNNGCFHQKLEKALAEYLGVNHIALLANGTIALMTALKALRIKGKVITTPFSFVATSHALLWNDITPVFVDIDPVSLTLDPNKIEEAITDDCTAILPVHCYGYPCDVASIRKIADANGLKVIYDAAHAFGVRDEAGGSILRHGDLSVLSFHATKVFNTCEGGAIVCPDAKMKQEIDLFKNFGFIDDATVVTLGINGKMNEMSAAFGLLQLQYLDQALQKRKAVDSRYRKSLEGIVGIRCLPPPKVAAANYGYFPIFVQEEYSLSRDALLEKLHANGVHARRYFYPLISEFSMYRNLPSAGSSNLKVARKVANEVICLPIHPNLTCDQIDFIVELLANDTAATN